MVGALGDEFGDGLACRCPVQFVLYDLEELQCLGVVGPVICRKDEDVAHLEIHALLAGADVADAFEQFIEIIGHAGAGLVFQALVVENKAFLQVFLETGRGPLAESRAAMGADAVTDCDDHFQAVILDRTAYLAHAFRSNY